MFSRVVATVSQIYWPLYLTESLSLSKVSNFDCVIQANELLCLCLYAETQQKHNYKAKFHKRKQRFCSMGQKKPAYSPQVMELTVQFYTTIFLEPLKFSLYNILYN